MKSILFALFIYMGFALPVAAQNYCTPYHQNGASINPIVNFAFSTLLNFNATPDSTGYAFYPESRFTTNLNIGQSYSFTVTGGGQHSFGWWRAWIDYNDDGTFDTSEQIMIDSLYEGSVYRQIKIPNNVNFIGKRRLRIVCGGNGPCDSSDDGYTQDYIVNITQHAPHPLIYGMPFEPEDMYNILYIDVFRINTLVNSQSGCDSICYSYYIDSQFSTRMDPGEGYSVYMSDVMSGANYAGLTGTFALWIDLNNDSEFSEAERLFVSDPCYSAAGTIYIPSGTPIGIHRLRVRYDWVGLALGGTLSPYGLGSAGSTQDYDISIGHTSGIEDNTSADNQFIVYPNPIKDKLCIKTSGSAPPGITSIALYNEVGQLLNTYLSNNGAMSSFDLSNYPAGFYLVNIVSQNGETSNYKIIKQ
jgi:hypothetical protein